MAIIQRMNQNTIIEICDRLWITQSSLKGLSSLFSQDCRDFALETDEIYGIGKLILGLSQQIEITEDELRSLISSDKK